MKSASTAGDALFTAFAALCAVGATVVFIAIGSTIARLTFSGHHGESAPAAGQH